MWVVLRECLRCSVFEAVLSMPGGGPRLSEFCCAARVMLRECLWCNVFDAVPFMPAEGFSGF